MGTPAPSVLFEALQGMVPYVVRSAQELSAVHADEALRPTPSYALFEHVDPEVWQQWAPKEAHSREQAKENRARAAQEAKAAKHEALMSSVRRSARKVSRAGSGQTNADSSVDRMSTSKKQRTGSAVNNAMASPTKVTGSTPGNTLLVSPTHVCRPNLPVQVERKLLPPDVVRLLLKGGNRQKSVEDRNPWPGISAIAQYVIKTGKDFRHPYISEISSRDETVGAAQRLDIRLTTTGLESLLTEEAFEAVQAVIFGLQHNSNWTGQVKRDGHVMIVLPGAGDQVFHVDSARSWFYYTLLFPLTHDPVSAGKTEFFDKEDQPCPPADVGDCIVFDGRKRHRGQGNKAPMHVRIFFYIAAYSGADDTN